MRRLLILTLVPAGALIAWVMFGTWPDPAPMRLFHDADAIVILGGGDAARWRQGLVLAAAYPEAPLIVTGDQGVILAELLAHGIPAQRIRHETAATSTVENARLTRPVLDQLGARRVILVTNWFHAPRSLSLFRKYQPDREFVVSFEAKPASLSPWEKAWLRHERLAAIHHLLVHGVWCF